MGFPETDNPILKRTPSPIKQVVILNTPPQVDIFNTPSGKCKITKMYVNPSTGKIEVEFNDVPIL